MNQKIGFISLNNIWIVGLLSGLLSAALVLSILFFSQTKGVPSSPEKPLGAMDILDAYHCPLSDKKHIFSHDKEDNYFFDGTETSEMHPRLLELGAYRFVAEKPRVFDSQALNKTLVGYFEVPAHISKGIFVVKMKASGGSSTDGLSIGDLYTSGINKNYVRSDYVALLHEISQLSEWEIEQDIYTLDLAGAKLKYKHSPSFRAAYSTLLEYINAGEKKQILDYMILDDTAVDFVGLALCAYPQKAKGHTFTEITTIDLPEGLSYLNCAGDPFQDYCNVYRGDTQCDTPLPLACFYDNNDPLPENSGNYGLERFWAGGEIKLTDPIAADQFATREQAQAHCTKEVGSGWQLVDFALAGGTAIFSKAMIDPGTRVWIDVKDQKYANCWSRPEE